MSEESFRPMLDVLSQGDGLLMLDSEFETVSRYCLRWVYAEFLRWFIHLHLCSFCLVHIPGNPIQCDCDIAWLVLNRKFLKNISGKCHNGTEFKDLKSDAMKNCLRQCPHQCVKIQWSYLCKPGTVDLSKVDNCWTEELCCQMNLQTSTTYPQTTTTEGDACRCIVSSALSDESPNFCSMLS